MLVEPDRDAARPEEHGAECRTPDRRETRRTLRAIGLLARRGAGSSVLLHVFLVLAVLYTLVLARGVLLPVFLAVFLSILLHPIVRRLQKLKVPQALGAGIVVAAFSGIIAFAVQQGLSAVTAWMARGSPLPMRLVQNLDALERSIGHVGQVTAPLRAITGNGAHSAVDWPDLGSRALAQAGDAAVLLAVVIVLLFFLLAKGADTLTQIRRAFLPPPESQRWVQVMLDIKREIGRYLITITAINFVLGAVVSLSMWIVGMPSPLLWGSIAALLNFMPYLGTVTTTSIIAIAAFLTFDAWPAIVLPPCTFLALTILEGNLLTPMIIGHRLTLNPISVFVSFLFWGWAWGPAGVLIAVPILAVLKVTFSHIPPLRRYGVLFG